MNYVRPSDEVLEVLLSLLEWKSCDKGYLYLRDMTEDHITNAKSSVIQTYGRWNGISNFLWRDLFQFELDRRAKIRRQELDLQDKIARLRNELRTAEIKLCNLRTESYV